MKHSTLYSNKRVLITAGPTWVPIDKVRVISNISTGETGILLAHKLKSLGAKVTLVIGPVVSCCIDKQIRLKKFRFFEELKNIVLTELKSRKYDFVIHSAAVSDYKPGKIFRSKLSSGIKNLKLNLIPTQKIISLIKKIDGDSFLVGFKFEPDAAKDTLMPKARKLISQASADLVVANTVKNHKYCAYIVGENKFEGPLGNKKEMTEKLVKMMGDKYGAAEYSG